MPASSQFQLDEHESVNCVARNAEWKAISSRLIQKTSLKNRPRERFFVTRSAGRIGHERICQP